MAVCMNNLKQIGLAIRSM
ncbi:MAG: DUF1559 domain-containing protein [Candidatus Omnitrophica bacterium]|nr:DUF1559 domain-containing protein [Candidatus Omnitrophota bacterium]